MTGSLIAFSENLIALSIVSSFFLFWHFMGLFFEALNEMVEAEHGDMNPAETWEDLIEERRRNY